MILEEDPCYLVVVRSIIRFFGGSAVNRVRRISFQPQIPVADVLEARMPILVLAVITVLRLS